MIRLLVVDDQDLVRQGIVALLVGQSRYVLIDFQRH